MTRTQDSSRRRDRRGAFTLFEMLIVIALIALLAGVAVVNFDKLFGENQKEIAGLWVNTTGKTALGAYRYNVGSYPTTAQGLQALLSAPDTANQRWKGPYLDTPGKRMPTDPWGNPYQYRYPGTKNTDRYDLYSFGPDGVESADDIGNW